MFGIEDYTKPLVDWGNFDFSQLTNVLIFGGAVLLIGIVTVFAVLCLLWLFLVGFRIVFYDLPEKRAKKNASSDVVTTDETSDNTVEADDTEIIAVIAAAIAMAESDSDGSKFRVVSFKRV